MSKNMPTQQNNDDEIDLRELCSAIWKGKWLIIITTLVFTLVGVFYALSLPNIYKSEVLLAPVSEDAGLNLPRQLGGLAALAGVNLNKGGDKTGLAIEILKSRAFVGRFIQKNDLFIPLMASKEWNRSSDSLVIDKGIFNVETNQWVREVKLPFVAKPSALETYRVFMQLFSVSQDTNTGMITFSVSHFSPYLAKDWTTLLVKAINDEMRNREVIEAEDSLAYLNSQIEQTSIADVKTMLYSLIEEQSKTLMLANVRDEYVFKTVDPAVVSERKDKPSRMLICILALMLGGMLSLLIVLVRYFLKRV
jgi:LPS O-antigen subunit length determinant protein (WzzB/FepE family)